MRIVCPSCDAAYEVPDSRVTPGRMVRCARCAEEWVPVEEAPPPVEEEDEAPSPVLEEAPERPRLTAMERLAQSPAPLPKPNVALRAAWAASVAVLLLLVWGAYAWRADVARAWPPSERVYGALGLVRR